MISYQAFTKRFGDHDAVDRLTLEIGRGVVVALLGPNGSGKTTTLKAAAGLIRPSAGQILIGEPGRRPDDPQARVVISYLPQRVTFAESLTGREVVEFYRELRGLSRDRTGTVLKFAALNGAGDRPVGTYSGGMVQRLGLAVAMLANSEVMLLDEPTAALDPDGLCSFYGLVERRKREGKTVFFTSHQLGDVERLADWFAVLAQGKLVASLTERELSDRLAERGVLKLRFAAPVPNLLERVRTLAPRALWVDNLLVVPSSAAMRPQVIDLVRETQNEILGLTAEEGRLDTFYREIVGEHP